MDFTTAVLGPDCLPVHAAPRLGLKQDWPQQAAREQQMCPEVGSFGDSFLSLAWILWVVSEGQNQRRKVPHHPGKPHCLSVGSLSWLLS